MTQKSKHFHRFRAARGFCGCLLNGSKQRLFADGELHRPIASSRIRSVRAVSLVHELQGAVEHVERALVLEVLGGLRGM